MASRATLLLLADGRLPAGAHAHSGGLEAAVASGRVHDVASLDGFLRGRLATAGLVAAAFAAAACHRPEAWPALDVAVDARTPSPALRRASRTQGRALLRAGKALWTMPDGPPDLHHAVALGLVGAAAGLDAADAAVVAAHGCVSGPAGAAVRLLGLDPYPVHALLARLATSVDAIATKAAAYRDTRAAELPAASAPLLDISAEDHATWEVRLFAS
jgi:urease accessory protein